MVLGRGLSIGLTLATPNPKQLLVAFRPPSRNTAGFTTGGCRPYGLPRLEFLSSCQTARFRPLTAAAGKMTKNRFENWFVLDGVSCHAASVATSHSALTFATFEVLGHGTTVAHAAACAVNSTSIGTAENLDREWAVGVSSFNEEAYEETDHAVKQESMDALAPLFHKLGASTLRHPSGGNTDRCIFVLHFTHSSSKEKMVVVARRLACGPAVDLGGCMANSRRRPRAGVLSKLALHARRATVPTAMEPEIAICMANMGQTCTSLGLVLDPFCGSGSLLLAAAWTQKVFEQDQAQELVLIGSDAQAFVLDSQLSQKVAEDFSAFQLGGPPFLSTKNIFDYSLDGASISSIVTDPPYNVKAPALPPEEKKSAQDIEHDSLLSIYRALLELAAARLKPGGRLVLFVPKLFSGVAHGCGDLSLVKPLPSMLRLKYVALQTFRADDRRQEAFKRSLVVLEKRVS